MLPDNDKLYYSAVQLVAKTCTINNLSHCPIYRNDLLVKTRNAFGLLATEIVNNEYVYHIEIDVMHCRAKSQGWSYPGYRIDCTPYGVLCHEFGHYIYRIKNMANDKTWKRVKRTSRKISSYGDVNYDEAFADTFMLFMTNPDMLKNGSPDRYLYITDVLDIEPVINKKWDIVLRDAPFRIIDSASGWTTL